MKRKIYKTSKSRGGRTALPDELKRKPRAMVHMNNAEYSQILEKADKAKLSVSEYLREIGIKGKIQMPDQNPMIRAELLTELSRQGQNYNQITKKINAGYQITSEDKNGLNKLYLTLKSIYDELQRQEKI